jgi:hypothetical protein
MLIRLRTFGGSHGQLFPDTSPAHAAFAVIGAELDRLEALDVAVQSATAASRTARKADARRALAESLTRAAATARVVARTHPGVAVEIHTPLPPQNLALLTLARQFAASAAPCAAEFAAHGIPLAQVDDRVAAFAQALREGGMRRDDRVKARAEIAASFARALEAVTVLDVAVANCLGDDPVALAVWQQDRRIGYPRGRRDAVATDPAPAAEAGSGSLEGTAGAPPAAV